MIALLFVFAWLVAVEESPCEAPAVSKFVECQAHREARIRWERD